MYLHNDKELFNDIVALTAERIGQAQDIVEKDYYVTMILRKLSACEYPVCFKGGTNTDFLKMPRPHYETITKESILFFVIATQKTSNHLTTKKLKTIPTDSAKGLTAAKSRTNMLAFFVILPLPLQILTRFRWMHGMNMSLYRI